MKFIQYIFAAIAIIEVRTQSRACNKGIHLEPISQDQNNGSLPSNSPVTTTAPIEDIPPSTVLATPTPPPNPSPTASPTLNPFDNDKRDDPGAVISLPTPDSPPIMNPGNISIPGNQIPTSPPVVDPTLGAVVSNPIPESPPIMSPGDISVPSNQIPTSPPAVDSPFATPGTGSAPQNVSTGSPPVPIINAGTATIPGSPPMVDVGNILDTINLTPASTPVVVSTPPVIQNPGSAIPPTVDVGSSPALIVNAGNDSPGNLTTGLESDPTKTGSVTLDNPPLNNGSSSPAEPGLPNEGFKPII